VPCTHAPCSSSQAAWSNCAAHLQYPVLHLRLLRGGQPTANTPCSPSQHRRRHHAAAQASLPCAPACAGQLQAAQLLLQGRGRGRSRRLCGTAQRQQAPALTRTAGGMNGRVVWVETQGAQGAWGWGAAPCVVAQVRKTGVHGVGLCVRVSVHVCACVRVHVCVCACIRDCFCVRVYTCACG